MNVHVVDYGFGNLASARRACERCGAEVTVSSAAEDVARATCLLLPGVGAFGEAMARLRQLRLDQAIRKAVLEDRIPILGICLGMQLLASLGREGGDTEGLDILPGEVARLEPSQASERVPHVGWNQVVFEDESNLFEDLESGHDFYFVHSYAFQPRDPGHARAWTPYAGRFVSVVGHDHIWGVQFHPEKSSKAGLKMLQNFLESAC
ncbi:MAG: imidazole glycerol phosphate synthase subunit HisH [Candidatus Eremiobacteraeota bacterium]|nr:imidazole glycerol phosphate synthase subunit HisH [Candidatus Eremiobacteraeota bacterium]